MKRIFSVFIAFGLIFLTTGCFNSGDKVTCTYNYKGIKDNIDETLTTTIKDDKVTIMKRKVNYDLSKYDETDKQQYFNTIKNTYAVFESEAFTSSTEIKDNQLVLDVKIDFTKATKDEIDRYTPNYTDFLTKNYTVEEFIKKMETLKYKCQ